VNKQEYAAGTVLAANLRALTRTKKCSFQVLFQPAPRLALDSYIATANYLVVHTLEDVKSRLTFWKYLIDDVGAGAWELVGSETSAVIRGISLSADDDDRNDLIWMTMASFLTPSSLFLLDASEGPSGVALAVQTPVKSLPPQFDSTGLEESQGHATSVDGEIIPYFMIRKKDAPRKEKTPCLLYGYGRPDIYYSDLVYFNDDGKGASKSQYYRITLDLLVPLGLRKVTRMCLLIFVVAGSSVPTGTRRR
jgi:prolyl oligopeptidase